MPDPVTLDQKAKQIALRIVLDEAANPRGPSIEEIAEHAIVNYLAALPSAPVTTPTPLVGSWPRGVHRAFVEGAKWWEWVKESATMWPADVEKAEAMALVRYGPAVSPRHEEKAVTELREALRDLETQYEHSLLDDGDTLDISVGCARTLLSLLLAPPAGSREDVPDAETGGENA